MPRSAVNAAKPFATPYGAQSDPYRDRHAPTTPHRSSSYAQQSTWKISPSIPNARSNS